MPTPVTIARSIYVQVCLASFASGRRLSALETITTGIASAAQAKWMMYVSFVRIMPATPMPAHQR